MSLNFLREPHFSGFIPDQIPSQIQRLSAEKCFVLYANIMPVLAGEKQSSQPNKLILLILDT